MNPTAARDTLTLLVAGSSPPEAAKALADLRSEFDAFGKRWPLWFTCPACGSGAFPMLFAAEHARTCFAHPAVLRARQAEEELAALIAGSCALGVAVPAATPPPAVPVRPAPVVRFLRVSEASGGDLPPSGFLVVSQPDWERALKVLADPALAAADHATLEACARVVEAGISEWETWLERRNAPCPGCAVATPLNELTAHLMTCPAHPENQRGAALEQVLARLRGPKPSFVGLLIRERDRKRLALASLEVATRELLSSFSWDDSLRSPRATLFKEPLDCWKAAMVQATSDALELPLGAEPTPHDSSALEGVSVDVSLED